MGTFESHQRGSDFFTSQTSTVSEEALTQARRAPLGESPRLIRTVNLVFTERMSFPVSASQISIKPVLFQPAASFPSALSMTTSNSGAILSKDFHAPRRRVRTSSGPS